MSTTSSLDTACEQALSLLKQGNAVALPTETVYGLAVDARNPEALAHLFELKGRPAEHPLIVHLASAEQLEHWADAVPEAAGKLAEAFWPGPLTLILPKKADVPDAVTGGKTTIALRVPQHPMAQELLQAFGSGLAIPSANKFGRLSPTKAKHVRADFTEEEVPLILDGGQCEVGLESTIVDLTGEKPEILRPGAITAAQVEAVLGQPVKVAAVVNKSAKESKAPGTLPHHYAPEAPLKVFNKGALEAKVQAMSAHVRNAVISFNRSPRIWPSVFYWKRAPQDAEAYAQGLYNWLREADQTKPGQIWVELPPDGPDWLAIHDRLKRASS